MSGKRRRSESLSQSEGSGKRQRVSDVESRNRGRIEHKKGSIIRVAMHNFVTYNDCEFFPGPLLNVVIGPNGSGKSSIVCGLVLGLGGAPKLLGRAKQVKEFIRHGNNTAWVELELCRLQNGNNVIIRRTLREDNSSEWQINGKIASKQEIKKLIQSANIQIDNVCQFLPQDKVVEFAKLDQYQLLRETEKAVGPPDMIKHHEALIQMYNTQTQSNLQLQSKETLLKDLKTKNEVLERDVIRFREREKLLKEVVNMKKKRPWIIFRSIRKNMNIVKRDYEEVEARYKAQAEKCEPLQNTIAQLKQKLEGVESSRAKKQSLLKTYDAERKTCFHKLNQIYAKFQQAVSSLENLKTRQQDRAKQAEQIQRSIEQREAKYEQIDISRIDDQIRDISAEIQLEREKDGHINEQITNLSFSVQNKQEQLRSIRREITNLSDAQKRRLEELRSRSKDAYHARIWVENAEKEGKFKQKVYGPVLLEVKVQDQYHARCFETHVPFWLLEAFICQNQQDNDMLIDSLKQQNLKVNVSRVDRIVDQFPPDNIHDIKKHDIVGWLDDFVDAPTIVKSCLRANTQIHTVAVGTSQTRPTSFFNDAKCTFLYTPESVYRTTTSLYGNRNRSTTVYPLRNHARFIKDIDVEQLEQLKRQQEEINCAIQQDEVKKRSLEEELRKINEKVSGLKRHREDFLKRKKLKRDMEVSITELKRQLEELKHEEDTTQKEAQATKEIQKYIKMEIDVAKKMRSVVHKETQLALKIDFYVLSRAELAREISIKNQELRIAQEEFSTLKNTMEQKRNELRDLQRDVREAKNLAEQKAPLSPELEKKFEEYPDDLEELKVAIVEAETRANLNYRANPQVIKDYEARCEEIKELEAQIDDMNSTAENAQQKIERIKSKWLPPLKKLIEKISLSFTKYFKNIGCFGRVELAEDDDFAKYGIQIYVSFRLGQDPQILDAFTQSGGERSVTTMLYLVSLQDLTDCPFRLVDEINQGMDPTNERMIFEEVSKSACKPNQPQFFLITPKLLPGLVFTPEMTVLCVMNGPWMVPQKEWDKISIHKSEI